MDCKQLAWPTILGICKVLKTGHGNMQTPSLLTGPGIGKVVPNLVGRLVGQDVGDNPLQSPPHQCHKLSVGINASRCGKWAP